MALSTSVAPTTGDRTLPIPTGPQPRDMHGLSRRNSSLLNNHVGSDQLLAPTAHDAARRCVVAYSSMAPNPDQDKSTRDEERSTHRSVSVVSIESMTTSSSDGLASQELSSGYCLCKPDPHVPRPRNAFILYRQHQQAAVLAQNPRLSNPEISKIVGEQWRRLPSIDKNKWKALAEQEKARHAQQFPDYRYRPRRSSKLPLQDSQLSAQPQISNCTKCGGKLMNPPQSSHNPIFEHGNMIPVVGVPRPQKRAYSEAYPQQPRQSIVQVASTPYSAPMRYGFGSVMAPRHDSVHYPLPPPPRLASMTDDGPEAKRRRIDQAYVGIPLHTPIHHSDPRERCLYHPGQVLRPPITTSMAPSMAPPSMRANHGPLPPQASPRGPMLIHQRRDPNLILPPLRTTTAQPRTALSPETHTNNWSLESTIMSFPILTKLKTLSLITPNRTPSTARGTIIAIEGLDPSRVFDMTNSLAEQLTKEGSFDVRVFNGPNPYPAPTIGNRTSTENKASDSMTPLKYLNLMRDWHSISQDLTDFVNGQPPKKSVDAMLPNGPVDAGQTKSGTQKSPISAISPKTLDKTAEMTIQSALVTDPNLKNGGQQLLPTTPSRSTRLTRARVPAWKQDKQQQPEELQNQDVDMDLSEPSTGSSHVTTIPPPPQSQPPTTPPPPPSPSSAPNTENTKIQRDQPMKIPIALVPHYQLTTVDACAIAFPVTDSYDVLTHWRWHATIWRGCIGPDISVVMKSMPEQQDEDITMIAAAPVTGRFGSGHAEEPSIRRTSNAGVIGDNANTTASGSGRSNSSSSGGPQAQMQTRDSQQSAVLKDTRTSLPPFSVEVLLKDHNAVIVRTIEKRESGSDADREKENELWEKAKRRVGFEVEENLRK